MGLDRMRLDCCLVTPMPSCTRLDRRGNEGRRGLFARGRGAWAPRFLSWLVLGAGGLP